MEKEEEGPNKKDGEATEHHRNSAIAAMAAVAAGERSRSNSSSSTSSVTNRNNKLPPSSSSKSSTSSSRKPHDIPSAALDPNLLAAQALFGNPYAGLGVPGSPFAFLGQPTGGYPSVTSSSSHPFSNLSPSMDTQAAASMGMNPAAANAWLNMANQMAAQEYLARLAAMNPGSHPAMFMGHSDPMMAAAVAAGFPLDFLAAQHAHFGMNAKSGSSSSSKSSSLSSSNKSITSTAKSSNTSTTSSFNVLSNNEDLSRGDPFSQYMKQTTSITGPKVPGTTNRGRKKTISLDLESQMMAHPSSLFSQFPVLSPQLEISPVERRGEKSPRLKESLDAQGKPEVDLTKLGASSELSVIRLPSGTQKLPAAPPKDKEKNIYGDPRKGSVKTPATDEPGCAPLNLSLKPQDKTEPTTSTPPPIPRPRCLGSEVMILDLSSKGKRTEDGSPKTNGDMVSLSLLEAAASSTSARTSPSPPFHKPRNLGRGTSKPKKNTVASLLAQSRAMGLQLSSQAAVALANNQVSIMKSSPTSSSPSPTPSPLDSLKNSVEIEMIPKASNDNKNTDRTVEKPSVTVERLSVIHTTNESKDDESGTDAIKEKVSEGESETKEAGVPDSVIVKAGADMPEHNSELKFDEASFMDDSLIKKTDVSSSGSSLVSDGSSVSSEDDDDEEDDDDDELISTDGENGTDDTEREDGGQKRKLEQRDDENGKKRRRIVSDEKDLRIPLGCGWKRETQVRSISQSGVIRGEVMYVGPCGKRFKQYPEVLRYLDKNRITNLSREHFSFSTKVLVGDYLIAAEDGEELRLTEEQVVKRINQKRSQKGVRLSQLAEKIRKKQMEQKRGSDGGSNVELSEEERIQQEEEMKKRQKEVEKQRREYLAKLQEKEVQKQQALFLREQERERRRQHMMLVKALETRKRQEERERRREELRAEKRATKERRIQERRLHIRMLEELNKPVEDMKLTDHVPLPNVERIQSLRLSGKAFADVVMVFEFLHTFGETLGFDMESLPTLSSMQAALLGDEESEEELLSVMGHLLVCAIEDPGVPLPTRHTTILGHNLKQAEITPHNLSDILRIYFTAIAAQEVKTIMGFTADRKETHSMIERSTDFQKLASSNTAHRISDWLNKRPFLSFSPAQKACVLAHICNELLQNKAVVRQIDGTVEKVINLKKKRWSVEQRCRKVKMMEARQLKPLGKSDFEEEQSNASELSVKKDEYMFETPEKKTKDETEEEEEERHESGNESEEEKDSVGGEEEEMVGQEDVDKKLKELTNECESIQEEIIDSSLHLRALHLGQDRMKRRYWVLASAGGVYLEGEESGTYQQETCSCKKVKLEPEDTPIKEETDHEQMNLSMKSEVKTESSSPYHPHIGMHTLPEGKKQPLGLFESTEREDRNLFYMMQSMRKGNHSESQDSKSEEETDNKLWRNGWKEEESEEESPTKQGHTLGKEHTQSDENALTNKDTPPARTDHEPVQMDQDVGRTDQGASRMAQDASQMDEDAGRTNQDAGQTNQVASQMDQDADQAGEDEPNVTHDECVTSSEPMQEDQSSCHNEDFTSHETVQNSQPNEHTVCNETVSHNEDVETNKTMETVSHNENMGIVRQEETLQSIQRNDTAESVRPYDTVAKDHSVPNNEYVQGSSAIVCDSSDPKPESKDRNGELLVGVGSLPKSKDDSTRVQSPVVADSNSMGVESHTATTSSQQNGEDTGLNLCTKASASPSGRHKEKMDVKPSIKSEPLGPQNLVNIRDLIETSSPIKDAVKPMMMPNQGLLLNGVSVIPAVYVGQEKWFSVVPRRPCDEGTIVSSGSPYRSPSASRCSSPSFQEESPKAEQNLLIERQTDTQPIPPEFTRGWWRLKTPEQLKSLMGSLHPRGIREKELRRLLTKEDFIIKRSFTSDTKRETSLSQWDEDNENDELDGINRKARIEGESILKTLMRTSPYDVHFEHGAPRPDTEESWSRDAALRVDLTILDQVENLEEKVAGASMQVKGWRVPTRLTTDEEAVFRPSCEEATGKEDTRVDPLAASRERLLLLEAAIERRYLKSPLGHSGTINLATGGDGGEGGESEDVPKALYAWRDAVGSVNSPAQLSMCLSQLEMAIAWDKSIMKASCQFCHSGDREEMLLLCDGCDKGYHTYCFKPKMDNIPDGDWYCYECINKATGERHCLVCGKEDKIVCVCDNCPRAFHPDCLNPPLTKIPRGKWYCPSCSSIHGRSVGRRGRPKISKVDIESNPPDTTEDNSNGSLSTRRNQPRKNSRDMTTCWALVAEMETHEDAWPFLLPVNTKQFPTYKKVIKNPMDLSTIKRKLEEGGYKTREDFLSDARLIFDNCETFNEDDSPVGKAGHTMRIFFETKWQELTGGT